MRQSKLFEQETAPEDAVDVEQLILLALGEFQARGKVLAERVLPLDRLRGALRRATESIGAAELEDARAVAALRSLGAEVRQVPSYVAKHPFRIIIHAALAERARRVYEEARSEANEHV